MNQLIISFISPDRPGLVDILSNVIKDHQGNWQTSSMHHMSGFFAGVIEVTIAAEKSDLLIASLKELPDFQINIACSTHKSSHESNELVLDLTANDRAGIVQEISSVIHHQGGNLIKVVSGCESAAHSGQDIFKATAHVAVNHDKVEHLITALEKLADDLMVDIK